MAAPNNTFNNQENNPLINHDDQHKKISSMYNSIDNHISKPSLSTSKKHQKHRISTNSAPEAILDDEVIYKEPHWCNKCIGKCLFKLEPWTKKVDKIYGFFLYQLLIICIILLISRAKDNTLFGPKQADTFFKSESDVFLLLATFTVMFSYSLKSVLSLRIFLSIGCTLFAIWALHNKPMLFDTFIFNSVMVLLNLKHLVLILYDRRYIEFDNEFEQIYRNIFSPFLVRCDFQQLITPGVAFIRKMKKNEIFKDKGDEITSLCVLVSGRIEVCRESLSEGIDINGDDTNEKSEEKMEVKLIKTTSFANIHELANKDENFVNFVSKNEFVEAPQWLSRNLDPEGSRFEVAFKTLDDIVYIKWPRETLVTLINNNEKIKNAMKSVLGLHTARALLRSREYKSDKAFYKRQRIDN